MTTLELLRSAADNLNLLLAQAIDQAAPGGKLAPDVARANLASLVSPEAVAAAAKDKAGFDSWTAGVKDLTEALAYAGVDVKAQVSDIVGYVTSNASTGVSGGFPQWLKYAIVVAVIAAGVGGTIWYLKKSGNMPKLPAWKMGRVERGGRRSTRGRRSDVKMRRGRTGIWEPEDDLEGLDEGAT